MTQTAKERPVGKAVNAALRKQLADLPHSKERSSEMLRRFGEPSKTKKVSERRHTSA